MTSFLSFGGILPTYGARTYCRTMHFTQRSVSPKSNVMQPTPSPKTTPSIFEVVRNDASLKGSSCTTVFLRRLLGFCATSLSYMRGLVVTMMLGTLQAYKLILSPLLGRRCRFHPTCSCYAQQSIARFGPIRGGWMALHRLCRCGPWHPGGIDEVPSPNAVNRNRA